MRTSGSNIYKGLIILIFLLASACSKKIPGKSFYYKYEMDPTPPVITDPTSSSNTISLPYVQIKGCFFADCSENAYNWTIQEAGTGTLTMTSSGFTYDATLLVNEVRVFSFTTVNSKGVESVAATITVSYDASVMLLPVATIFHGGISTDSPPANSNGYKLDFLTLLPSLVNSEISSNGYVLSGGGLNPQ